MTSEKIQEKKLFTPGPLGVSPSVRAALNRDLGSRDTEFISIISSVRQNLVEIAGLPLEKYTCVLLQGSGTFAVESVLLSSSDRKKVTLVLVHGAYGSRMMDICKKAGIPCEMLEFPENCPVDLEVLKDTLEKDPTKYGSICVVHCETTSGVINPIKDIIQTVKSLIPEVTLVIDAMSSFGGVVEDFSGVDFLISSANKCLQGVPGFAFIVANKEKLKACEGKSLSLSLDLYDQWKGLETTGQFRFTPPTHCILGLDKALKELMEEGGVEARAKRYRENNRLIKASMASMGFQRFVSDQHDGHIITSFKYPNNPSFNFTKFYDLLSLKGQLIYPGKVTNANCFRIGNIGHLFPSDMEFLASSVKEVLGEMGISLPVNS